jgi:hypothetical protein
VVVLVCPVAARSLAPRTRQIAIRHYCLSCEVSRLWLSCDRPRPATQQARTGCVRRRNRCGLCWVGLFVGHRTHPPSARVLRSGRVTNHRPIEKRYLRVDCTRQCGVPNLANMTSALHLLLSTIPKIQLPCISIENIDIQIELIQIPIKLISIRMKLSDDLCNHSDNLYQSKRRSRPCFTNQFGLLSFFT